MATMFGSNVTVISQSESKATCMDSDPHPAHDWWYTSEGGGHMLNAEFVDGDRALGIDVRQWHCPGVPGATYHGITRYEHPYCGYVTSDVPTLEMLNDLDPACPSCGEFGEVLWSHTDGTVVSMTTEHADRGTEVQEHLTRLISVNHIVIHKSMVNGPEWWIDLGIPDPDWRGASAFVMGFDSFEEAVHHVPSFVTYCVNRGLIFDWRVAA